MDPYDGMSNFCDLPELPQIGMADMSERTLLTSLDQLDRISKTMVYNEASQVSLFQQKNIKVFGGGPIESVRPFAKLDGLKKKKKANEQYLKLPVPIFDNNANSE